MKATFVTCVAACSLLGGCAVSQPPPPPKPAPPPLTSFIIGKSTKAEVRAALGEAVVVDFASGYEVWVYREPERVLLFEPSGILSKTRISFSAGKR